MTRSCIDEAQNSKRHQSSTRNRSLFATHRLIGRKAEAASYSYDASNNRVRSEINGTAYELLFNLTGQKVAITSGGAVVEEDTHLGAAPLAAFFNGSLNFEHQDWLGTERFLTGSDGSPIGNYTSYPFGDGYVDNGVDLDPYHFAGMDHDYESTLDHATFREYANAGGRWVSPDPYQGSYDWSNPQSLNRYSYALNNPLSFTDAQGRSVECTAVSVGGIPATAACTAGSAAGDVLCGPICGELFGLAAGGVITGLEAIFGFGGPQFDGVIGSPGVNVALGNATQDANVTFYVNVLDHPLPNIPPNGGFVNTSFLLGASLGSCIVVNGATVCPSPIDYKYSIAHRGQKDYRDNKSICSLHVLVDKKTGQVAESHTDLYNPNVSLFFHVVNDLVPDIIYDLTKSYPLPPGRSYCQ